MDSGNAIERTFSKTGRPSHGFIATRTPDGFFRTHDKTIYHQDAKSGTIRRLSPKVKGKAARKAEKAARRRQGHVRQVAGVIEEGQHMAPEDTDETTTTQELPPTDPAAEQKSQGDGDAGTTDEKTE